jgi:hypothetical protein
MVTGEQLVSTDGRFRFILQNDGNLVLYRISDNVALWSSNTSSGKSVFLRMQGDGNLVLYGPNSFPLWNSSSFGTGAYCIIQNDGNVVVYSGGNVPLWATNTRGK